jgi:CTP:molybdopterin cytidylyltransferase MocA
MIAQVVGQLRAAGLAEIVVVTGGARAEVEAALAASGVRCVFNPDFERGDMGSSLQAGLRALPAGTAAALVALADQPQIQVDVIQAVLQRWRETLAAVVAPSHDMRRGHPLLLDRNAWPEILRLPPGANPRDYLRAAADEIEYVEVETDSILRDVDTPEDYAREQRA